jgi:hypothetical protein
MYFLVGPNGIGTPEFHGPYEIHQIWDNAVALMREGFPLEYVQGRSGDHPVTSAQIKAHFQHVTQHRSPPKRT